MEDAWVFVVEMVRASSGRGGESDEAGNSGGGDGNEVHS